MLNSDNSFKTSLNSQPLLDVQHLTKHFPIGQFGKIRHVHAVEDVSFSVESGQVVAVVGESGSGKSTTIRLISRLMPVTDGKIVFHGDNVLETEPKQASSGYRRKVQMIFQDPFSSLNSVHTIEHHLSRPLIIHKLADNPRDLREKIYGLLSVVGLNPPEEFARRYPHQLSGGQRQRVAIARALAVNPELILADEPISMLDVSIRIGILNLMAQLKEERGIAYVYITHDLASARYIGDKIMVMYAGHMVEGGPGEQLLENPSHPYTRLLLSAVPDPQAGLKTRKDIGSRGEVPVLVDPPPGCPFTSRCPKVMDICRRVNPPVKVIDGGHWTRCYLFL
jgi:peptide/nickel transport system ATP-binding protein